MRTLSLLLALAGLVFAGGAVAHFGQRTDSLYGFVSRSDVVVVGAVMKAQRFEEKGHTTVPGALRLRVDEVIRGQVGGDAVGILVEGMHQPRYAAGERVLVFADRRGELLRSLQSRGEKIVIRSNEDPVVAAVRRYAAIVATTDAASRERRLKRLTLELLRSAVPRLHQDAVFDLSRRGLLDRRLGDRDLRGLGELALDDDAPLVVREGIAAKLGVLASGGRAAAAAILERLALEPKNPAVRVAALHALERSGGSGTVRAFLASTRADNPDVRRAAVEALAALRSKAGVPALIERLGDPDRRVRFAAVKALHRIDTPQAREGLRNFHDEGSAEDRELIAHAISARRSRNQTSGATGAFSSHIGAQKKPEFRSE